ncbi:demethylmenaquinone methyltransferase family protein [Aspergillus indologenus CBS 114.80]|uniref:Demethylmenaquinone methyltransferase family protein n=1 Tax=Aspergillus indologenus CBS 114.80 TaxID=1450541 RepID=A0A2V5I9X6_9EURO|nr:demethylmenaquinone methyltransferase family protein [Aspergillus indologenus CBS 114.80]
MSGISVLDRLAALDSNTVSDALDFLNLKGATYGLRPLWECPRIVGRASTVQVGPKTDAKPTTHLLTPVIDAVTTDDRVLKRIRGTIIDGMSRDIDGSRDVGYPVYGRGGTMISARNRLVQVASGTALQVRGVTVHQDDYVIADNCGTVFVPAARIDEVVDLAERIDRRQARMVEAVRAGHPVSEVMHDSQFEAIRQSESAPTLQQNSALEAVPPKHNPKSAIPEDKELVALFADSDTPAVSDALDKLGLAGQAFGIMPLANYTRVTVGPAFTVRYVPASDPPGSVGDFVDDVAEGDIVVIDNGGRTDCTVWGDIMTQYAGLRGIAGTVIDGVCRDVNRAISDDYPRDIVVADANGVVIVPRARAREVAEVARQIEKSEEGIREMVAGGATIAEARKKLGYHTLQRHGKDE